MRLEVALSRRSVCRVCRCRIERGAVRLQQVSTPFSCLGCVTCQQARKLLQLYGSFADATASLRTAEQREASVRVLQGIWRPTRVQQRSQSTRLWQLESYDAERLVAAVRSLGGDVVEIPLRVTEPIRVADVTCALALRPWNGDIPPRDCMVNTEGTVMSEMDFLIGALGPGRPSAEERRVAWGRATTFI